MTLRTTTQETEPRQWTHFDNPRWEKKDRDKVTVLLNAVERRKSAFLSAYLNRLGVKHIDLGSSTYEDMVMGKRYGTPGMCNAVYFIVGAVIRKLEEIREETGATKEEMCEKYVFVTPSGPCSPCRYGMYTQEYIKAINDAGYHGFRVLSFSSDLRDDDGGHEDDALVFDMSFRLNLLLCLLLADAVHARDMETRPYERRPGSTEEVVREVEERVREALRSPDFLVEVPKALWKARGMFDAIEVVDRRLPKVYITGEIFANNCNGDGNYDLREFCMKNGCEVNPAIFSTRAFFDFIRRMDETSRDFLYDDGGLSKKIGMARVMLRQQIGLTLTSVLVKGVFSGIGAKTRYPDVKALFELGDRYYNKRIFGGEGNLEIAEAIDESGACDGFISIKPFGCLPSSGVSDGVQAKVQEMHPELNFLSIETSGDNVANVLNRVSMLIFKAKTDFRARQARAGHLPSPPDRLTRAGARPAPSPSTPAAR